MTHHKVHVSQDFKKPVGKIYDWLSNHENLSSLFKVPVTRIKKGGGDGNGVGSVRRIGPAPFGTQETVTAAIPNQSIDYIITRFGGPVRGHSGRLEFSETDTGSRVDWTIEFKSLPGVGTAIEKLLTQVISRGLSKHA